MISMTTRGGVRTAEFAIFKLNGLAAKWWINMSQEVDIPIE